MFLQKKMTTTYHFKKLYKIITDRHIEIYVHKFYGEKIRIIKSLFDIKNANSIYHYCNRIDYELCDGSNKLLEEKIKEAKKKYKEWKTKQN